MCHDDEQDPDWNCRHCGGRRRYMGEFPLKETSGICFHFSGMRGCVWSLGILGHR